MGLLKEARVRLRLTQVAMAKKLSMSQQAVSVYEKGIRIPDLVIADKIAKAYDISLEAYLADLKKGLEMGKIET